MTQYTETPSIAKPGLALPDSTRIWRYMDAGAFMALLHMRALNLAPVLKMRDRWEGILPPDLDARLPFFQQDDVRRAGKDVYVSCWHASNLPSDAMWRLYSAQRGIAVETTLGELAHCVQEAGP